MESMRLVSVRTVGFEAAAVAVGAATTHARSMGIAVCVAVVDRSGLAVMYARMDGAPLIAERLASDKAYTAASFGIATEEWWERIREDPSLAHGLPPTERFVIIGGGMPVVRSGEVVGAVGVSGGTPLEDGIVARAGVTALGCV